MELNDKDVYYLRKSGLIAKEVRQYAMSIIKKDILLLDIAEKIEEKIYALEAKPAFPVNLCINEVTSHFTPVYGDKTTARGLLKVDFGVHVNGMITDCAFSVDLENDLLNKRLIKSSEEALHKAVSSIIDRNSLSNIGKEISSTAENYGFSPIRNLSGHSIDKYTLHSGITIPNYENGNQLILNDGIYAVEPFITNGQGLVYESKPSEIYSLIKLGYFSIRDSETRRILDYIIHEYRTLPFCLRWLIKRFGQRAIISVRLMEKYKILSNYPELVEKSKSRVAQSEGTLLIYNNQIDLIA